MAKREGSSSSNQESFFSWLSRNISESQYSAMSTAVSDLNHYFTGKHIVSESLFELDDKKEVARARARLESDRLFRFMNRGKIERMLQLLKQYSLFLLSKELESNQNTVESSAEPEQKVLDNATVLSDANNHISCTQTLEKESNEVIPQVEVQESATTPDVVNSTNQVNDTNATTTVVATTEPDVGQHENEAAKEETHTIISSAEPVGQDAAVEYLSRHDIPFADKRAQGGSLWILAGKSIYEQIHELRDMGYVFCYSPTGGKTSGMKPAWYLILSAKHTEQVNAGHVANQANVKDPLLNTQTKQTSERKEKFELWLAAIPMYKNYAGSLLVKTMDVNSFVQKEGLVSESLFELSTEAEVVRLLNASLITLNSVKDSKVNRSIITQVLRCYRHYLSEELTKQLLTNPSVAQVTSVEESKSPALSNELEHLLEGDDLALLRQELIKDNILTLDQFKAENLWVFMNRHNLYTISQRQAVYNLVLSRMKPASDAEPSKQYTLVTNQKKYYGGSPAEAFLEFCEFIAQKYPLKIRSLLDARYNGQGSVVLSKTDNGNSLKLMNPVAYISNSLTAQAAVFYGQWICKMCGELDRPVKMDEPEVEQPAPQATSKPVETTSEIDTTEKKENPTTTPPAVMRDSEEAKENPDLIKQTRDSFFAWMKQNPEYKASHLLYFAFIRSMIPIVTDKMGYKNIYLIDSVDEIRVIQTAISRRASSYGINPPTRVNYLKALDVYIAFISRNEKAVSSSSVGTTATPSTSTSNEQPVGTDTCPKPAPAFTPSSRVSPAFLEEAERIVLEADLDGISQDGLCAKLDTTMVATKDVVAASQRIVSLDNKLYHEEAFVDWEDGANKLEEILEKLLDKNNDYVTSAQLYEYVKAGMQMFLNDNDISTERMVYDMARHLFEKTHYHDKTLSFSSNKHISRGESVSSVLDLIKKYAREHDGWIQEEELIQYLQSVGSKTGNLRNTMRIYDAPLFFFYADHEFVFAESMAIDQAWFDTVQKALTKLFDDMGDHVVLRDIQPWWFSMLPALPGGREWTPLLLQTILRFYRRRLNGVRTICGMVSQGVDTLHAMIVTADSDIQSFADAVIAVLVDDGNPQRSFEAEELRQVLVSRGLVAGNELIYKMPTVLANDERFAWDAGENNVRIKV